MEATNQKESLDSTDKGYPRIRSHASEHKTMRILQGIEQTYGFQPPSVEVNGEKFGMDSLDSVGDQAKLVPIANQILNEGSLAFFAAQTFIGYQVAALLAQNWLVDKACTVKVQDAIKNWFTISVNDGEKADEELIAYINKMDKKFKLKHNLLQAGKFNNVFGIRHVLFEVDSSDPDYYEKPFNPDGITKGSYKGMTQIDPYWTTPYLGQRDVSDPASQHFYEPTHWYVGGRGRIHRSHFVILRGPEVADYLKPGYYYGGLSLAQRIYERVYAAERTANEAPLIAMSKRLNVRKVDLEKVAADPEAFEEAMEMLTQYRDNSGVHVIDTAEEHQQFDTALSDFDSVIMTQYQLVAAISNTPATKLINTSPKGFSSTGEFEIETYHEELESIQEMQLDDIVERHHICVMKSLVIPKFGKDIEIDIVWNSLKVESRKEKADINYVKAQTAEIYKNAGAIDQNEIRSSLITDKDSGWDGIESIEAEELKDNLDLFSDVDPETQEGGENAEETQDNTTKQE